MFLISRLLILRVVIFYSVAYGLSQEEKIIIDTYAPSKEFCRALINPHVYISQLYQVEREITCLLMGFRKVITLHEHFFKNLTDQKKSSGNEAFDALKKIVKEKLKNNEINFLKSESEIFLYRKEGKENAQLLLKSSKQKIENPYLYGLLLGYRVEDIDFFYKINAFQSEYNYTLPSSRQFYFWPQELKTKFKNFERNIWPKLKPYKKYEQDKMNAQNWIKK